MKDVPRISCPVSSQQRLLPVIDMFTSLRGEGRYVGHPAVYIVLRDCPNACLCEEVESVPAGSGLVRPRSRSARDLAEISLYMALRVKVPLETIHVVISGKEPMTHQVMIPELVDCLHEQGLNFVELETRGVHLPSRALLDCISWWSCSPSPDSLPLYTALSAILHTERCEFKFAIQSTVDIENMESRYIPPLPPSRIVLMPAGFSVDEQAKQIPWLLEQGLDRGYCVSPRILTKERAISAVYDDHSSN